MHFLPADFGSAIFLTPADFWGHCWGKSPKAFQFAHKSRGTGGEGGIRTHGTVARTTVFETVPIDHSGTSPRIGERRSAVHTRRVTSAQDASRIRSREGRRRGGALHDDVAPSQLEAGRRRGSGWARGGFTPAARQAPARGGRGQIDPDEQSPLPLQRRHRSSVAADDLVDDRRSKAERDPVRSLGG